MDNVSWNECESWAWDLVVGVEVSFLVYRGEASKRLGFFGETSVRVIPDYGNQDRSHNGYSRFISFRKPPGKHKVRAFMAGLAEALRSADASESDNVIDECAAQFNMMEAFK